ncbi:DUF3898 domain-containing protein [Paenibacillus lutimineralis]|uniref:DUF3898 domain-containing protein n=1 Tax=Paenibacillus lutimineralis TaxID=2707005 RepID=UPI001F39A767|nr:DUF3898 domain-containing protein [Paenibacillus lutimineralis]
MGDTVVKGELADFGNEVHIAKLNGRYAVILEGESISFDKAFSPVELLQPDSFEVVAQRIMDKKVEDDDLPPF